MAKPEKMIALVTGVSSDIGAAPANVRDVFL